MRILKAIVAFVPSPKVHSPDYLAIEWPVCQISLCSRRCKFLELLEKRERNPTVPSKSRPPLDELRRCRSSRNGLV
jgi:hypothetical protein